MLKYSLGCLLAAAVATAPLASRAQTPAQSSAFPAVYTYVQQMPVFPGGQPALLRAVAERITYPEAALQQGIEGQVFIKFVVSPSGAVAEPEVVKGPHPLLNEAALAAVRSLPPFEPGRQNGKPVPVAYALPVNFRLPAAPAPAAATQAESQARFPGGPEALRTFLSNQPLPPGLPAPAGPPARVFVEFEVDETGAVRNAKAAQLLDPAERRRMHQRPAVPTPNPLLLAAAVARVGEMPAWEPATKNGQRVASTRTEVVTFGEAGPALSYADEMPVFPIAKGEGYYTATQIRYPAAALRSQTQGAVLLYYEVAEDGRTEKLEVIRSVSPEIDAEALRVFSTNFPQYQPARHQGRPARVYYVIPVTFKVL